MISWFPVYLPLKVTALVVFESGSTFTFVMYYLFVGFSEIVALGNKGMENSLWSACLLFFLADNEKRISKLNPFLLLGNSECGITV